MKFRRKPPQPTCVKICGPGAVERTSRSGRVVCLKRLPSGAVRFAQRVCASTVPAAEAQAQAQAAPSAAAEASTGKTVATVTTAPASTADRVPAVAVNVVCETASA
jgi:hypothetical protein